MPYGPVDDKGTQLYYEETGSLEGGYLTVVLVHGTSFHGAIFHRMFPFAAAHRLRLVAVNRRDYRNSTPLSEEDLALLSSEDDGRRTEYFRRRGFELGRFLAWFAKKEDIPPLSISEDGKEEGGIVLVGWSSGNTVVRPLFAYADEAPEELRIALEPYMRAYGLYDVPRRLCGLPDIAGFFRPFLDNSELPPEQQLAIFETWVSGYYSHPDVMSRNIKGLTQQLPANVALGKPPTLATMTLEDRVAVMDPAPIQGHEMFINSMPHEVYLRGVNRMFEKNAGSVWPRCKVKMIWCEQALGECVTGAWDLIELYDEKAKKGEVTRVMITTSLPGANHFIHWDEPEKVTSLFANFL